MSRVSETRKTNREGTSGRVNGAVSVPVCYGVQQKKYQMKQKCKNNSSKVKKQKQI